MGAVSVSKKKIAHSQSKPRKAAYKDTNVSLLSLKAHFAVSDDHPTDKSTAELGMLMLQHVPSPEKESLPWKGEYFDACTDFARTNQAEMKHNNCNVDQLLKATSADYFTGLALWRKAQDAKRIMLNEMHAVFCQEVCPQWPTVPSGTTTIDPLLLELRKKLWVKKWLELKDGRVNRANVKKLYELRKSIASGADGGCGH